MSPHRSAVVCALALLAAGAAHADPANHLVANYGSVSVPFTHSIGNTFSSAASGFVSQDGSTVVTTVIGGKTYFYDDFVFSLPAEPEVGFNAAAVTIDLNSFLSIQNFSGRLYKLDSGLSSLTTGLPSSGTPIQTWTATSLVGPGFSGTSVLFQNVSLQSGATYALEFRGTITGSFGGSYGGNLNITPVPESGGLQLALASVGVMGWVARRCA